MQKTQQLNELFDRWQQFTPAPAKSFVRDGIINEALYDQQKTKVLFLCKEPNQTSAQEAIESSRIWDFREWWRNELWGGFSICLSTWAKGIISGFVPFDEISDSERLNALHSVSFMNIKKTGGLGNAVWLELYEYVNQHKDFIVEEIDIIKPSFIIASIKCLDFKTLLFDNSERVSTGHGIDIVLWRGIPIIDFYHPSSRAAHCMSYALLKVVIESDKFQSLLHGHDNA